MWFLSLALGAIAAEPPMGPAEAERPTLELRDGQVFMDGERTRIWNVRKPLIANPGSREAALKAKRTGASGVVLLVAGGVVMASGGAWAILDEEPRIPGRITFGIGAGTLLVGGAQRLRSFGLWKRAIPEYDNP